MLMVLTRATRQENQTRTLETVKTMNKTAIHSQKAHLTTQNIKESAPPILPEHNTRMRNEFIEVIGYKFNTQKSILYLNAPTSSKKRKLKRVPSPRISET